MNVSLFSSATDNAPRVVAMDWPGIVEMLRACTTPHPDPAGELPEERWTAEKKRLPAWSPVTYADGAKRGKGGVTSVHAFVADLDDVASSDLLDALERLRARGLAFVIHDTPSSVRCAEGVYRARIVVPLAEAVPGELWSEAWSAIGAALGLDRLIDPSTKDASRLHFLPVSGARVQETEGRPFDAAPVLANIARKKAEPPPSTKSEPRTHDDALRAYLLSALDRAAGEVSRAPKGERNNALNYQAHRLAGWLWLGGFSEVQLRDALGSAARRAGLGDEEIRRTLDSAIASAPRRERPELRAEQPRENAEQPRQARFYMCTDLGNAERLADQHGADVRHVAGLGWFVWDGRRWLRDDTGEIMRRAKRMARSIYGEAERHQDPDKRKAIAQWAAKSESRGALASAVALASTEKPIAITVADLDRDPWALNCENGTIDLRTGALRPHRREDLITKIAGCAYDPNAKCPLWEAFLARVVPLEDVRRFLQRFAGYALTGDVREQILVFAHGSGANGKSTFTESQLALLNDYAKTAAPELLLTKSPTHPTEQADLLGLRLVVCQEVEEGRRWSEVTVKQLTGGDRITARRMREDFFSFVPTHKLIVAANHKPGVRGTDHAIWRRMRLVPFDVVIPEAEKDPMLSAKLRAELPGILAWAVRGCLAWQAEGLTVPAAVEEATRAYRSEEDVLGRFLDECTVSLASATVRATGLYQAYARWAHESGEHAVTQHRFGRAMAERGVAREKDRLGWFYRGLGLRVTDVTDCDPRSGFDTDHSSRKDQYGIQGHEGSQASRGWNGGAA